MIPAHDSPLAALAFDASGTKLATASEKVFPSGTGLPIASSMENTLEEHIFLDTVLFFLS